MATVTGLDSFTAGTPAKASEVNNNFSIVKTFVENLSNGVNIDPSAISTAKIADYNVTEVKLATGAVTSAKIADLTIVNGDIANSTITNGKLDYTSVPKTTVSSTEPVGPKAGDVWVQI